jgi:signal transduction histidine kinase
MKRWSWLLALLPFALGFLAAVLLNETALPNPTYRILISLSTFLILLGLVITVGVVALLGLWRLGERRRHDEMERLLKEATLDRRRFLQRLDHELKNPLMAIRAGLANLREAPTDEARRAALGSVEAQTMRLSRLTTDLRKIAELESRPLERTPVDLRQLLQEVVEMAQSQDAEDRQGEPCPINLILPRAPWPLPEVAADWDLVYLAVYNLLDNARKFSDAGCAIEVRGREDGRYVVVEVADTGPGIDPQELAHIWEELYRGESGRAAPGSGLGLALVKAIAERHGGFVTADSKLQQGTVVAMYLPIQAG